MTRVLSMRIVISDTPESGHSAVGVGVAFANIGEAGIMEITAAVQALVSEMIPATLEEVESQIGERGQAGAEGTSAGTATKLDA